MPRSLIIGANAARSTTARSIRAHSAAAVRGLVAFNERARAFSRSSAGSQNQPWSNRPVHENQFANIPYGVSPQAAGISWILSRTLAGAFAIDTCETRGAE